ncbi:MAG TPA: serine--tRNA ligase, partial [Chitinophagaceae bacterium]
MLQVAFIRNNTALVKERLAIRNFKHPEIIDELILWDDKRKEYERKEQEVYTKIRLVSKEIGELIGKNKIQEAEAKKEEVKYWKSVIIPGGLEAQNKIQELLYLIPNLPHTSVPAGKTPEENITVREGGTKPALFSGAVPHWDLAKKYDLINFEL